MVKFVAEIGSNWIPTVGMPAKDMIELSIREAYQSGATAVKFQYFTAEGVYSESRAKELFWKMKGLELGERNLETAAVFAALFGLDLWVSVFDPKDVRLVADYADVVKVASGDLTNNALMREVSSCSKPTAISTGGALDFEIENALRIADDAPILFYCISEYPANDESFRLKSIWKYHYDASEIGLSDHSKGSYVAELAVAAGYTVFEKHFRSTRANAESPDYNVAIGPLDFASYVQRVLRASVISGGDKKLITVAEAKERLWARRGKDGLRPTEDAISREPATGGYVSNASNTGRFAMDGTIWSPLDISPGIPRMFNGMYVEKEIKKDVSQDGD